jgi:hypothetical protein
MYLIVPKVKNQVLSLAVILESSLKTAKNQRIKKPLLKALEKVHSHKKILDNFIILALEKVLLKHNINGGDEHPQLLDFLYKNYSFAFVFNFWIDFY